MGDWKDGSSKQRVHDIDVYVVLLCFSLVAFVVSMIGACVVLLLELEFSQRTLPFCLRSAVEEFDDIICLHWTTEDAVCLYR